MEFEGDTSLSSDAVSVIDDMIWDMFHKLATEATNLMVYTGRRTLMVPDINNAAHLFFKGGIADHAIENARLAVLHFIENTRRR